VNLTPESLAMTDFQDARARMILGQVKTNDVQDTAVIGAMETLPRERFVPKDARHLAYADLCVPIGRNRFLLDPRSLAKLLQAAQVRTQDRVLEIASGYGYTTAILAQLSADVVTLEEDRELAQHAAENLKGADKLGTIFGVVGPHRDGHAAKAPYDLIFVNGAVAEPPATWAAQLKDGGRLLAITNQGPTGNARIYVKNGQMLAGRVLFDATVPLLPGFATAAAFAF
jgi:protein-L-isoaspartate(D-aspartate) O-methyltransferase